MPHSFIAAVDLGASNLRVAIANSDGEIEARRTGPLPPGAPAAVLDRINRTIDDLARGVWVGAQAAAIGIVLPGAIDPDQGTAVSIANMPGWDNVRIADALGRPRGVPVAMENDANAAAVGEGWLGAAKGLRDYVFIALGTGIGAGVVLGGRLHRGSHFLAGEIAFFPMTREHVRAGDWEQCLEGQTGGRAAARTAAELLGERARAADLFDAAKSGHAAASAWVTQTQEYIAMAVADIAALLDPQAIVFGGGVVAAQGEWFLDPIREMALRCAPGRPKILMSSLGEDAQIAGAVRLALDRLQER
jgi:predicted NBD/HSP70 family sugar kinase